MLRLLGAAGEARGHWHYTSQQKQHAGLDVKMCKAATSLWDACMCRGAG